MIGAYAEHARTFVLAYSILTTVVFTLPIFLTPLAWARGMRFAIPAETDLAVYFGRCLGGFLVILELLGFRAAFTGIGLVFVFEIQVGSCVAMIAVHVYGAAKGIQPVTETLEIGVWVVLLLLGLAFFPVGDV